MFLMCNLMRAVFTKHDYVGIYVVCCEYTDEIETEDLKNNDSFIACGI
jgi:hypothetical protein